MVQYMGHFCIWASFITPLLSCYIVLSIMTYDSAMFSYRSPKLSRKGVQVWVGSQLKPLKREVVAPCFGVQHEEDATTNGWHY